MTDQAHDCANAFAAFNNFAFEPSLEPDHQQADAFSKEHDAAEERIRQMILDHTLKPLVPGDYEVTDDSEVGRMKFDLHLDIEVDLNKPADAARALRLLADGISTLNGETEL